MATIPSQTDPQGLAERGVARPTPSQGPSRVARVGRSFVAAYQFLDSAWEWIFGVAALILALAVVATLPLLQVLSLGYLLEASGRVARSGQWRSGLIGIRKAARIGSLIFGGWLLVLPVRFVASLQTSAQLIEADSRANQVTSLLFLMLAGWAVLHFVTACLRGGRLRHFLFRGCGGWPSRGRTSNCGMQLGPL